MSALGNITSPLIAVSFNPPGEDGSTLNLERASLGGQFVACTFYGMEVLLYILTAYLMLTTPRSSSSQTLLPPPSSVTSLSTRYRIKAYLRSRDWKYFLYITVQFILCSMGIGGSARNVILSFVDDRGFPGGPIPWSNTYYNTHASIIGNTSFIVSIWLQDGFLLYRFLIIWQYNWLAFVLPCLMYLASIAFSLLLLIQLSTTGLDINASTNQHVGIVFWSLSIALNVILTGLIVGRLAWVKRVIERGVVRGFEMRGRRTTDRADSETEREKATPGVSPASERGSVRNALPPMPMPMSPTEIGTHTGNLNSNHPTTGTNNRMSYQAFTNTYTSVGAMLIESAAVYTAFNVSFLVTFIVSEAGSYILLTVVGVLAAFSPTLIAYRVIQGKGWSRETAQDFSSGIIFSQYTGPSSSMEEGGDHGRHVGGGGMDGMGAFRGIGRGGEMKTFGTERTGNVDLEGSVEGFE